MITDSESYRVVAGEGKGGGPNFYPCLVASIAHEYEK